MNQIDLRSIPWGRIPKRRRLRVLASLLEMRCSDVAKAVGISSSLMLRIITGKQKETAYNQDHIEKMIAFGIPQEIFCDEAPEDVAIDWAKWPRKTRVKLWYALNDLDADMLAKQMNISRSIIDRVMEGTHNKRSTPYYETKLVALGVPKELFA